MILSLKQHRADIVAKMQLDYQRLQQAPLALNSSRKMIIRHLDGLRAQLALCETLLRSLQNG